MTYEERLNWKCYCPECHHTYVKPGAVAEELKVAYIDFTCQGCGQAKTILVLLLPEEKSLLTKLRHFIIEFFLNSSSRLSRKKE